MAAIIFCKAVHVCEQRSDAFDPIAQELGGGEGGGGRKEGGGGRTGVRQAGGWADGPWKCNAGEHGPQRLSSYR